MSDVHDLLEVARRVPGCVVDPPRGLPTVREGERVPDDLLEFYRLCGGARLFENRAYPIRLVEPDGFVRANPVIVGRECPDDISDAWYIVARGGAEEAISIDCSPERLGRCYDSFWDRHGVAGDCSIVALSFTELLRRLLSGEGEYWYWLVGAGPGYGDAYDE